MNLISERGSVTRSSLVCKATCCGSQSRAPFRRPGSWSQCMRKRIERRLSMNRTSNRRFLGVRGHVRALFRRDVSRRGKRRHVAALQDAVGAIGSWSQCMREIERRLSMNRGTSNIQHPTSNESKEPSPHPDPLPSHPMGAERGQPAVREPCPTDWQPTSGSWSQCMRKIERRLSMNRGKSNIE